MPSIPPAERAHLIVALGTCSACGGPKARHYCRSCDEFFLSCECPRVARHVPPGHRVYLWTPSGVLAVPDFDNLR